MNAFLAKFGQTIQAKKLLKPGQPILVAVSGGLDSMVLLHALHRLAEKLSLSLVIAHFNHQLRGRSSDADEALVRRTVARLGLRCLVERGKVREFARRQKLSLEMAARTLRHDFFARTAAGLGIKAVALAHHADDQVELFFLRLLRGAGGEGLAGMDWVGPSPSNPAILLIRPFLDFTKQDLRSFAELEELVFREDASNASLEHDRNRIRHELLPLLRQNCPGGFNTNILRVMEILGAESDFVRKSAASWGGESGGPLFDRLHVALQRRWLQMELDRLGIPSRFDLIERLRCAPERSVMVSPERVVWRDAKGHLQSRAPSSVTFDAEHAILDLGEKEGKTRFGGLHIFWRFESKRDCASQPPAPVANCECFDAAKVGSPVILRHWRPGDRFQPIGMTKPVKVQDLFTNRKIPRPDRHLRVLAATAKGEIFWIEGLRISESFKLEAPTAQVLKWRWRRQQAELA